MENNNYVNVGNIIEQERLKRQAQIAKGVSSDVYDHIEKAHQDDLSKGVEMTDNLSRFANDVDNFNKAETEFLLSKLQRQIVADPESFLLKSFKSIAINHLNDLEKAHQDGEMHPNGKWVWVSSANGGKGDWRTANGRAHKKHQETHGKKEGEGEKKTIDDQASGASTDALKRAAADKNAETEVREAAKKELEKRSGNKSTDNEVNQNNNLGSNISVEKLEETLDGIDANIVFKKWTPNVLLQPAVWRRGKVVKPAITENPDLSYIDIRIDGKKSLDKAIKAINKKYGVEITKEDFEHYRSFGASMYAIMINPRTGEFGLPSPLGHKMEEDYKKEWREKQKRTITKSNDNTLTLGEIFAKAQDCLTPSFNSVRFESDVYNLSKAETENLLGQIQAEILKGGDYDMLTEMRSIAIDHIVDIEKGGGRHAVGEQKSVNGKTYVWTEYAPGKFDWRPVKKNAAEKVPDKEEVRKYLEDKAPAGTKVTDQMIDKVINNVRNKK